MIGPKLKKISIIDSILLVIGFIANIYGFMVDHSIQYICNIIALLFAVIYCVDGYKKEGQLFFKLFAFFLSIKEAIALIHIAVFEEVPPITIVIILLCYTCSILLAFCLDLGKKNSYAIAILLNVLSLISVIFILIETKYLPIIIYNLTRMFLASILYVMVVAKFEDKESRNAD